MRALSMPLSLAALPCGHRGDRQRDRLGRLRGDVLHAHGLLGRSQDQQGIAAQELQRTLVAQPRPVPAAQPVHSSRRFDAVLAKRENHGPKVVERTVGRSPRRCRAIRPIANRVLCDTKGKRKLFDGQSNREERVDSLLWGSRPSERTYHGRLFGRRFETVVLIIFSSGVGQHLALLSVNSRAFIYPIDLKTGSEHSVDSQYMQAILQDPPSWKLLQMKSKA